MLVLRYSTSSVGCIPRALFSRNRAWRYLNAHRQRLSWHSQRLLYIIAVREEAVLSSRRLEVGHWRSMFRNVLHRSLANATGEQNPHFRCKITKTRSLITCTVDTIVKRRHDLSLKRRILNAKRALAELALGDRNLTTRPQRSTTSPETHWSECSATFYVVSLESLHEQHPSQISN